MFLPCPNALRWDPDKGGSSDWMDGYAGEDEILVDEMFDVEHMRAKARATIQARP